MSDTLRDRIAKVIADYLRGELNWGDDLAPYVADAVIEALRLTRVTRSQNPPIHRYVTSWETTDE